MKKKQKKTLLCCARQKNNQNPSLFCSKKKVSSVCFLSRSQVLCFINTIVESQQKLHETIFKACIFFFLRKEKRAKRWKRKINKQLKMILLFATSIMLLLKLSKAFQCRSLLSYLQCNDVRTDVFANAPNKVFKDDTNKLILFSSTNANIFFWNFEVNYLFRKKRINWAILASGKKKAILWQSSLKNQLFSKNYPKKKLHEVKHEFSSELLELFLISGKFFFSDF